MSVPFIPLILLFLVALTAMLVGLCLSSKTLAADQYEIEGTSYNRATRQGRSSKSLSIRSSHRQVRRAESYVASRDERKSVRIGGMPARSKLIFETCSNSSDLPVDSRRELISNQAKGKYRLVTSRKGLYHWSIFFLICGLVFSGGIFFLYRELNSTSSKPLFTVPYQSATDATPKAVPLQIPQGFSSASKALKRLAQMDRSQYSSEQQYDTWAASACSTVAMTEVINAYGYNYHISDILQAEISQSTISSELGLLKLDGIDRTVAQFGFSTAQLSRAPLDSLISVANNGWPIIVDFPPSGDWPTGHFVVVVGGDSDSVMLADSAPSNLTSLSYQQFLRDWGGFAVVDMPKKQ